MDFSYILETLPTRLRSHADDLEVAAAAAWEGGRAAMRHYQDDRLAIRDKGLDDPVTEADHDANAAILRVLGAQRPKDPVLSEESKAPPSGDRGDRLWIVDPLDGTKEFIARNGEFCIMVGLADGGASLLGAIYQPDPGLLYLGVVDGWAAMVEPEAGRPIVRRLRVPETRRGPMRLVESSSHPDARLQALERAIGEPEVVRSGSVGIKCALVARGEVDLYVHPVPFLKEWDTCAPEAVLRGAGGRVTDCAGRRLRYGKADPLQRGGVFAARADVWTEVAPAVRRVAAPLFTGAGEP